MKSINLIYEGKEKLVEFLKSLPKKEILLQIFCGVVKKEKIKEIITLINKHAPFIKVIGTTTSGEIINSKVTVNKIVLSFSIFDKAKVKTFFVNKIDSSFEVGKSLGKKIGNSKVAIIFSNAFYINPEEFLKGVSENTRAKIVGGLAGDNLNFLKTYVFDNEKISERGVVCAVIDGEIFVNNTYIFNWQPIGKKMKITKAFKNIIYEINNKPALEIYKHYFGELSNDLIKVGVEFPLMVKRNGVEVARALIKANEDGSIVVAGNIYEGEDVRFGFGEVDAILKDDKKMLEKILKNPIESIFIYSCVARKIYLGRNIEYEISAFSKIAPVSGFFTYGEFFNDLFFNETMVVLTLSESDRKVEVQYDDREDSDRLFTIKALSHLVRVTSEELNELNENLERKIEEKTKEIIEKNKELEYLISHDSLTGLYNKFEFGKDMKKLKKIMLIDIKDFSKINDSYGEMIGDEVLKEFGRLLKSVVDLKIYRIMADQFIIGAFEEVDFRKVYEKLKDILKKPLKVKYDEAEISFDVIIRAAVVSNLEDMKLKADLLLKYMKKNHYDFLEYSKDLKLEEKLKEEIEIINMVKRALIENRVVPVFQKILKDNETYYEALVRIKEGNTLISPYIFLEVIKYTDYYYDLTKTMIEKTFKIFSKRDEKVSINLSYSDIKNENMVEFIKEKIEEYGMKGRVIFEILEDEHVEDFDMLKDFIKKVKGWDIKIALDDFGSGYSNFFYLTEIKPDIIKIDGSLIKDIDKNEKLYIISKYIHQFAKEIGCDTIAEFVEDEKVYQKVKEIGVDGVQGYFIEKPKVIE